ncbi:MAG: hypothetical protein CSH49_01040 [Alcanivorax sp.]|nr:HDOD domain-containing protein [Ketobacter sp.]MEC8813896.1 HDOD domain-containing protein [Pseudomonadota bacterium]TNC90909.1 MAG: hypothetical protein CSH49_01040 [Alcanivorax sp.]
MASEFQPEGLESWVNKLDEQRLPVLPASARKVGRLLQSDDVSLHDLGSVIATDPVMWIHVVRECNRQFGARAAGVLANPQHCASMLGLDKLSILMRQFKAARGDVNSARDSHYFQAIRTTLHAAEQATSWAGYRNQANPDTMFVGALMVGVPYWCLWRYAHREMAVIERLFKREHIPLAEAEQAVLGCTREAIAVALAQRWHMPPSIQDALSGDKLPGARFLVRCAAQHQKNPHYRMPNRTPDGGLVNNPALPLALSHHLAQEAAKDWYSRQTVRCLSIIAAYLEQPLDTIEALAKQVAIRASGRWNLPGTQAPAANLIWPAKPRQPRRLTPAQLPAAVAALLKAPAPATAPKDTPPPAAGQPRKPKPIGIHSEHLPEDLDRHAILNAPRPLASRPAPQPHPGFVSHDKRKEFEELMQKLLKEPDYFSTEYESIRCVVDILTDSTALQRVLVTLYNRDEHTVETYYARGCEDYPRLKKCSVRLQPSNLFSQLLKQPAATWISPDRPSPIAGLIPGTFKQAAQSDHFFLMSVFNHRGAYGLFYADKGTHDRIGMSESEYKIFKIACNTCSKHLGIKGRRAAAKPANQ